jgi:hypothetical protein
MESVMKTVRAMVLSSTLAVVAVAAASVPASAAPVEQGHFHDSGSQIFDACGLTLRYDFEVDGSFLVKSRGPDGLLYGAEHLRSTQSFTNLANGKFYTAENVYTTMDQKVTDNGDGTLTVLVKTVGRFIDTGPDGRLNNTSGGVWFELLIDVDGNGEFLGLVKVTGTPDNRSVISFCDDLVASIA